MKIMESITRSCRATTAQNQFLTKAASPRMSMGFPLVFAFKSISIHVIAILVILCYQCIDCNVIPLPTSLDVPPSSSSLSSAHLLSASNGNAATTERASVDRVTAFGQVNRVVNLTRQYAGDVFSAFGKYLNSFLFN